MSTLDDNLDAPFDPTKRRLCPDETCIGLLAQEQGGDDRCRVCGRRPGEEPMAAAVVEADEGSSFASGRKLCPDGSCIGVIGPDGRCKECGRAEVA